MNLLDLLQERGVPHWTEGRSTRAGWVQLVCPICQGEKYLGFNQSGSYFHCWRCGRLDRLKTLTALLDISFGDAKSLASNLEFERLPDLRPKGKLKLPSGRVPLMKVHRDYLEGRGFDPDELERQWNVQGIGLHSKLAWRIFIPITFNGDVVSWTTRGLTDNEPRYVSASLEEESMPHKELLMGEDYVRGTAIIVEGPFDMMRIGPGAVATAGISFKQEQLARMSRFPTRAVCFDAEPESQRRASRLCDSLSVYPGKTVNVVLDAKDPGSASEKEIKQLRKSFLE